MQSICRGCTTCISILSLQDHVQTNFIAAIHTYFSGRQQATYCFLFVRATFCETIHQQWESTFHLHQLVGFLRATRNEFCEFHSLVFCISNEETSNAIIEKSFAWLNPPSERYLQQKYCFCKLTLCLLFATDQKILKMQSLKLHYWICLPSHVLIDARARQKFHLKISPFLAFHDCFGTLCDI